MLVPFNLWLPELLSTPNCSAIGRCLPAMTECGWMTLLDRSILVFVWHSPQGAGYACGIWSGLFFWSSRGGRKGLCWLCLLTLPWETAPYHGTTTCCISMPESPPFTVSTSEKPASSSDMLDYKTQQMRMPLKHVALIVKEFISLMCCR